jgi:hypothetical protein
MPTTRKRNERKTTGPNGRPPAPSHEAIAMRAYEIFLRRGGAHGYDYDDWLAAERELLRQPARRALTRRSPTLQA